MNAALYEHSGSSAQGDVHRLSARELNRNVNDDYERAKAGYDSAVPVG